MSKETSFRYDVVFIIPDLGPGGAQRVLSNIINAWAIDKKMAVITLADESTDFFKSPIHVSRLTLSRTGKSSNLIQGLLSNINRIFLLRNMLKTLNAKSVISFLCSTNILAIIASIGLKTKIIISERNDPAKQPLKFSWKVLRVIFYRFATRVTANTVGALETMKKYVPRKKLFLVPNPIILSDDTQKFDYKASTILAVGRLHHQKGYDILLTAFHQFQKGYPTWKLAILGEGDLKCDLNELSVKLNIDHKINWYGTVSNPLPYYLGAKMFVLPSRFEGSPNALLEAMHCSLPVIVSNASPGPLEYVENNINGLVIPTENAQALAEAMMKLAADDNLRNQLGLNASERVRINNLQNVLATWESILTLNARDL